MQIQVDISEHVYNNIMALDSISLGRIPYKGIIMAAINAIKSGEIVNEERTRKGHWIYDYTTADGHRTYHCSECGCYLKPKHSELLNSFKWCSLCGADMRGEEE